MNYEVDIAGMKKSLKLFKVSDDLQIAAFNDLKQRAAREQGAHCSGLLLMISTVASSAVISAS